MKKNLQADFTQRQYMFTEDFEIYYYNDINPAHVSAHSHNYYEIYFFMEGGVDYRINHITYSLQSGDYLLIPPGLAHRPIFHSSETAYRRFVLWISREYYDSLCGQSGEYAYGFDSSTKNKQYHYHADSITCQEIRSRILGLIESCQSLEFGHETASRLQLASLLLFTSQLIHQKDNKLPPSYDKVLYLNVCDYINNHLEEDLSLDRLASFFYVSKYHISHIMKDNLSISPHQYIVKKRLQAGKNALLTGVPATQVCHQYGFCDYTSFYRAFKKEYGMSPTEYIEQHQMPEPASPPVF